MNGRPEPVLSQRQIAEQSLAQAEAYVPRDEWGRNGKARNIAQLKAFIGSGGDIEQFLEAE